MSVIKISELNEVALYDVNGDKVFGGAGFTSAVGSGIYGTLGTSGAGTTLSGSLALGTGLAISVAF